MYTGSTYVCPQCKRGLVSGITVIDERPMREYRCWCGYRMSLSKRATKVNIQPVAAAQTA